MLTEGRLVIVPGDRDEVVMAACLAALNGTRLAALLLTVGVEPDPRVWELDRRGDRDRAADPAGRSAHLRDRDRACTTWTSTCPPTTTSGPSS